MLVFWLLLFFASLSLSLSVGNLIWSSSISNTKKMTRERNNKKNLPNSNSLKPDFYPMNHYNIGNDAVRCLLALQIIGTFYICVHVCMYVWNHACCIQYKYIGVITISSFMLPSTIDHRWMTHLIHLDCTITSLIELRIIGISIIAQR